MSVVGPVEYLVVGFPGNRFKGEIVPAIAELIDKNIIRLLDVYFIKKDMDGSIEMFEYDGLDDVMEFGFADLDGTVGGVLSEEDAQMAADGLEPNSSAALLVWEHVWAAGVSQAIRDAGGEILFGERIPHDVVTQALADLDA